MVSQTRRVIQCSRFITASANREIRQCPLMVIQRQLILAQSSINGSDVIQCDCPRPSSSFFNSRLFR